MNTRKAGWLAALITLFGRNALTLFGASLAGVSGLLIIGFVVIEILHLSDSPYGGIMAFLILPVVFIFGLLLVPAGAYWERRKVRRSGQTAPADGPPAFPIIDLNHPDVRRVAGIVVILTAVNLLICATAAYEGVTYMESVAFCGKVCHTVMEPEYTSYVSSPHSHVACIECHIGPGAPWFVRSKLSGLGQVLAVTFNTYERPIPTPVKNLRPSRDTCEECHWPERFMGDRVKVITKFDEDEANTPKKTVLLLHIGGGREGRDKGIHSWHISPSHRTIYLPADTQRQEMAKVRVENADGTAITYHAPDGKYPADKLAEAQERVMDCLDCHNRPTHVFELPERAVDHALAAGRMDATLPYLKKISVKALKAAGEAPEKIAPHVRAFYQEKYPDVLKSRATQLDAAVQEIEAIYARNVFPKMKVTWGTYPVNLGHEDDHGCFRCHDDEMKSDDGKGVGQDCTICHEVLAWDESDPDILKQLGLQ